MKPARQMANRQMYQTSIITTEVSSQQQNYVLNEEYLKGFYFANRNGKYKKVYGKKEEERTRSDVLSKSHISEKHYYAKYF